MSRSNMVALFCDDVRNEVGNKLSLMGVYGQDLLLPELPATLPKLCAVMMLDLPAGTSAREAVFVLKSGEEIVGRAVVSVGEARRARGEALATDSGERLSIRFIAQMSPMVFAAPCELNAYAELAGEVVHGGRLKVARVEEVATAELSARGEG
jgi:hypothetical protein